MRNVIYEICERLKGYSSDKEYFEVLQVTPDGNNEYKIALKLVDTEVEANDESNK